MKRLVSWLAALLLLCACGSPDPIVVTVTNLTDLNRNDELVEVSMQEVSKRLELADTADVVVLDASGNQIDYQITYDEMLVFPATVKAKGETKYTIQVRTSGMQGNPIATSSCGRQYPERADDIAWENDRVAFRCYGPALQASGERAFGYDTWVKNTPDLVVEDRYAKDLGAKAQIDSLVAQGRTGAADSLRLACSYHRDHGNGLDCYAVGPTLGDGTSALMANDSTLIYPYCYKDYEILDNGPLRFTMRLVYNPLTVEGDSNVTETRLISLDKGSYLNKTVLTYSNLRHSMKLASGVVLHAGDSTSYQLDKEAGFVAYADPTDCPAENAGKVYVGCVFPGQLMDAKALLFTSQQQKELSGGNPDFPAIGHVIGISEYQPNVEFVYYWGSAWSKAGFEKDADWFTYLRHYAEKVRNPLMVTIQ